jgi:hypothetical protein
MQARRPPPQLAERIGRPLFDDRENSQRITRLFAAGAGTNRSDRSPIESEHPATGGTLVIILGVVLLIIGFVARIAIFWTLGIVLVVVGAVLFLLGSAGRAVGGHRHYW